MKKLNSKGFTVVEVLIVVLVVVVLGGAGYYVYQRQNQKDDAASSAAGSKAADTEEQQTEEIGNNQKIYSNRGITFVYPSDWALDDTGSFAKLQSPNNKKEGTQRVIIKSGELIEVSQTTVAQPEITADNYSNQADLYDTGSSLNGKVVTVNGNKTFQFDKADPNGFDSSTTIFFKSDGTRVEVRVAYPHGSPKSDHTQAYSALVNSLKLN